jgi:hypothetical protein
MDSVITVRFFTVIPRQPGQPSFEACLQKLQELGENVGRKVADITVQANGLKVDGDRYSGDLIRFQTENLPSLASNTGQKPRKLVLDKDDALGHHAAFVYERKLGVLAYQIARNAVPLSIFNAYVATACTHPGFGFLPIIGASTLKELNQITPKTMLIKVADPDALDAIEDDQRKLRSSLRNLRKLADGAYVKVQIGLANNKGHLDKGAVGNLASWLLEQRAKKKGKIGLIQITGKDFADGEVDLDFLKVQLGDSKRLSLKEAGQDENFGARRDFLMEL